MIIRTYDQIVADMLAKIAAAPSSPTSTWAPSSAPWWKSRRGHRGPGRPGARLSQGGIHRHGHGYGSISRPRSSASRDNRQGDRGHRVFCRTVPKNENIVIPAGTIVSTLKDQEGKAIGSLQRTR
jgi:hypothetical protein